MSKEHIQYATHTDLTPLIRECNGVMVRFYTLQQIEQMNQDRFYARLDINPRLAGTQKMSQLCDISGSQLLSHGHRQNYTNII